MIADLKPYPEYKDSGAPWPGKVPEHWKVIPLCAISRIKSITRKADRELLSVYLDRGVVRFSKVDEKRTNVTSEDLSKYQAVDPGDFVLNNQQAWRGSVGVSQHAGIVSPAYLVLSLDRKIDPAYANLLFRERIMVAQYLICSRGVGSIQRNLYWPNLKRVFTILPPLFEQSAIVHFLDHFDHRINRLIRAKQKLIALLNEQKQAIIHHAVTRGLDPNARLKPSGVDWLGDVPEHWEVQRVKQLSQILRGKFTHRPRNDPSLYDGPYPFIQTGEVARATKIITTYRQTLNERGLAVSKVFPSGTLVMTIAANIGDVAILDFEACFPDSVVGFVPRIGVNRDYLFYVFRAMKLELLREAPVNTQGNLNIDRIGSRGIAVPPTPEQQEIVRYVEQSITDLNNASERAEREISLLREYRTRLIADVVTGKLDVREAAARLPEENVEAGNVGANNYSPLQSDDDNSEDTDDNLGAVPEEDEA